jgi:hypothetical protein
MKWPIYFHSVTANIGNTLPRKQKFTLDLMLKELRRYLDSYSLREDLMKDFLNSWKELKSESVIGVLKCVMKFIRHRLLDDSVITFHRLIHLINAMMRCCGTIAQVLVGRENFLRTLLYVIPRMAKRKEVLARESATFAHLCMISWWKCVLERKDLFPHFEKAVYKLKKIRIPFADMNNFKITNVEKIPVRLDREIGCRNTLSSKMVAITEDDSTAVSGSTGTGSKVSSQGNMIEVTEEDRSVTVDGLSIATPPLFFTTMGMTNNNNNSNTTSNNNSNHSSTRNSLRERLEQKRIEEDPEEEKEDDCNYQRLLNNDLPSPTKFKILVVEEEDSKAELGSDDSTVEEEPYRSVDDLSSTDEYDDREENPMCDPASKYINRPLPRRPQSTHTIQTVQSAKSFYYDKIYRTRSDKKDSMRVSDEKKNKNNNKNSRGQNSASCNAMKALEDQKEAEKKSRAQNAASCNALLARTPSGKTMTSNMDMSVRYYGTQRVVTYKRADSSPLIQSPGIVTRY